MSRLVMLCLAVLIGLGGAAAGSGAATRPTAPSLVRWPYVQNVTATSTVIAWATDTGGSAEVRFSTDQSYGQTAAATTQKLNAQFYHAATLTGLQVATTYYYRIWVDEVDLTPWTAITFATATTGNDFTFVSFGDSRGNDAVNPATGAQALAAQMINRPFDLAIHTGDLALDGTYAQYDSQYFTVFRDLIGRVPFYLSLGNHDYRYGNPPDPYLDDFYLPANGPSGLTERAYSFDWDNAHFVALDTNASYEPGSAQYAWLESDLAATTKFWKFVFFHHPPYSSASHGSDLNVRAALGPLLERYGVDLIFTGHDHAYERTYPMIGGNIAPAGRLAPVYFVTGGGGATLYALKTTNAFTAFFRSDYSFTRTEVHGCALSLQAIDASGAVFDTFTLNKCGNRLQELAPGMDYGAWYRQNSGYTPQSDYFGTYAIEPMGDTLYLGFGTGRPADVNGSLLASFAGDTVTARGALNEQGFIGMTVGGGNLYIPGPDPTDDWTLGNAYSFTPPGGPLVKHRTGTNLVNVLHMWGAWYDAVHAKLYAATSVCHEDIEIPTDPNCLPWYFGKIYASTDGAVTWSEIARGDVPSLDHSIGRYRTYDIIGFNGRLYATWNDVYGDACGLAESTDGGANWTRLSDLSLKMACRTRLVIFDNKLLALNPDQSGLLALATNGAVTPHAFPGFKVRDWTYNYLTADNAGYLYTVTDDGRIVRTRDFIDWQTVISTDLPLITVGYWPTKNWLVAADRGSTASVWKVDLATTSALTLPQAPGLAIGRTDTGVKLDWSDVTLDVAGQATTVLGYHVYRGSTPYFNSQTVNRVAAPVASEFPDTIGGPAGNRYYQVRTKEPTGNLSLNSGRVGVFSFALQPGQ